MTSLKLERAAFSTGGRAILSDISFEFEGPGIRFVVGPNGSGKSTLLKLCAGLLPPTAGQVLLGGEEAVQIPSIDRAHRVAWLAQRPSAVPKWPVLDYVWTGRYPITSRNLWERDGQERAQEILEKFGIEALAGRLLNTLSGGELELVRIARVLIQGTDLILLDEPLASLDLVHRARLKDVIRAHPRSWVVVSHDLHEVADWADEVLLLSQGRLVAQGKTQEVLKPAPLRETFGITF